MGLLGLDLVVVGRVKGGERGEGRLTRRGR